MKRIRIAFVISLLLGTCIAQTRPIDPQQSVLTVHVFKSGLFSAFADNHEIRAPISSGSVDEAAMRVDLVVDSRKLVVLDPNLSPDKRQQVQERMLGPEVLDSSHFHEIRFEASSIKQEARDRFLVSGNLSLHGKTRPISLQVSRSGEHFRGETALKQRDFGITPITIAGGTVKVKDELKIEFDVVTGTASPDPRVSSNRKASSPVAE
jgi:YceI-like protein